MPNLLQQVGTDYFSDRFAGNFLFIEGQLYTVTGECSSSSDTISVQEFDGDTFSDRASVITLPADVVPNVGAFACPTLGYRRVGLMTYNAQYQSRSGTRSRSGFGSDCVAFRLTDASRRLCSLAGKTDSQLATTEDVHARDVQRAAAKAKFYALYNPEYDSIEDFRRLVDGELPSLVLSQDVCIEPTVSYKTDVYDVLVRGVLLGHVNNKGVPTKGVPPQNKAIIEEMFSA